MNLTVETLLWLCTLATVLIIFKQLFNFLQTRNTKIEEFAALLAKETREALTEQKLHIAGLKDYVTGFGTDLSLMQKELSEFEKNLGSDEISKMANRISLIETSMGMRRVTSLKKDTPTY